MYKIINLFLLTIVIIFFFKTFNYYLSNKNIANINSNRSNINEILKSEVSELPILKDNTNNVINFNSTFASEIENDKPRSFWNLLKFK
jgi:hypothetical protein